jgi:hypothetical protein
MGGSFPRAVSASASASNTLSNTELFQTAHSTKRVVIVLLRGP